MKFIKTILILFLSMSNLNAQQDSLVSQSYKKYNSILINYQGLKGNTISFTYGLTKECNYCKERNVKFFGLGLELGLNVDLEKTIGTKIVLERGKDLLGIRGTVLILTTDFEEYGYVVRSEFVIYPVKEKLFMLGLGFNLGRNFNRNKLHFGVIQLSAGYNLSLK